MKDDKQTLLMIVDDNLQNLQYLAEVMGQNGYDYIMAKDGTQVFDLIVVEKPDLILLDVMMPIMDGYEVCRELKRRPEFEDIPIIFITAKTDIDEILEGFRAGGVDYVTKPFNSTILQARVKTHLELKRSRDALITTIDELEHLNHQLEEAKEKSEYLATRDYLTGLYNRRFMVERMRDETHRCNRSGHAMGLMMADIDFFKGFNDRYGHDTGDLVLKHVAEVLIETVRAQDVICRWGGEEFLLLLPETEVLGTAQVAEKIRRRLESRVFSHDGDMLSVTMTFGVAAYEAGDDLEKVISLADAALLRGKGKGRNCVVKSMRYR